MVTVSSYAGKQGARWGGSCGTGGSSFTVQDGKQLIAADKSQVHALQRAVANMKKAKIVALMLARIEARLRARRRAMRARNECRVAGNGWQVLDVVSGKGNLSEGMGMGAWTWAG